MKSQYEILENIKIPNVNEIVKLIAENDIDDVYQYAVSFNAHNSGKINQQELAEFIHEIYSDWYYNLRNANSDIISPSAKRDIQRLFAYPKFYPSNMMGSNCLKFFYEDFNNYFSSNEIRPVFLSAVPNGELNTFIQFCGGAIGGFKKTTLPRENKLYLNLKAKNILPFVKALLNRVDNYFFDVDIKITDIDNRSNNVIIYTNYQDTAEVIKIIEDIKADFSYLFSGSEKTGLLWGVINNYIGFGEEFKGDINTYGLSRAKAIKSCIDNSKVIYLKNIFLQQSKSIKVENGLELTPLEFVDYLIKQIIKLELIARIEEMGEDSSKEKEVIEEILKDVTKLENNPFEDVLIKEGDKLRECLILHKPYALNIVLETKFANVTVSSSYDFRGRLFEIFSTLNDKITISNYEMEKMDRTINKALYKSNCDITLKTESKETLTPVDYLKGLIKSSAISSLKLYLFESEKLKAEDNPEYSEIICRQVKSILKALEEETEEGKAILTDTIFNFQNQLNKEKDITLKLINSREINIILPYDYINILVNVFNKSKTKLKDNINQKTINKTIDKNQISSEKFIIGKFTEEEIKKIKAM